MRNRFWLSDEAWAAIEPHLPNNQPGARRVDDRRVISGILHVLKTGCGHGAPIAQGCGGALQRRRAGRSLRPSYKKFSA